MHSVLIIVKNIYDGECNMDILKIKDSSFYLSNFCHAFIDVRDYEQESKMVFKNIEV